MNTDSKFFRYVFVSAWPLTIFLVIPVLVILSIRLNIQFPLVSTKSLFVNNICLLCIIACRFLRYTKGIRKPIRYGANLSRPQKDAPLVLPVAEARGMLENAGYFFAAGGSYGEKQDRGYLGITLLYAGLLILLTVGTWDNLRQFSGTLLDGMGPATKLNNAKAYFKINKGILAAKLDSLPQMKVVNQFMPGNDYPFAATELALLSPDGKEQSKIIQPGDRIRYGAYDIYMTRIIFEPVLKITNRALMPLFHGPVKLSPLVQRVGDYSFYAPISYFNLDGEVYYQPEKNRLKVLMKQNNMLIFNSEMLFQIDQQVTQGDLILSCEKMGQWSEIHVVRRRHMALLMFGGVIALIGGLLRIALRPERVWLEETAGGCRIRAVGSGAKRLLRVDL
ncbi:MAG: hypothetical protein P4L44_08305 [Oryzomonas sp.]|uniref:hypothetical protein n=1 Tax=Oryzomonas sp. TaxID=2855186 RepID=UPI0028410B1C|nr:hypothetical protein [Oryzomonas sp.]MDR3579947.1 hypothetical protein [Oryzomonas sp.]